MRYTILNGLIKNGLHIKTADLSAANVALRRTFAAYYFNVNQLTISDAVRKMKCLRSPLKSVGTC